MHNQTYRAGVIGASGYAGREMVRLLGTHPRLKLTFATSESRAGAPVAGTGVRYARAEDVSLKDADVVFTCLPAGDSGRWALEAHGAGSTAVVDLSADLRGADTDAVYGLPEFWREEIGGVGLVANPGCYATGVLLALGPFVRAGQVDETRPIVINAASGVTGAGRSPSVELLYGEVAEDYRAYGIGNSHRHVAEIMRGLSRLSGREAPPFVFTPHLLPVRRGILETIVVPLADGVRPRDAVGSWMDAYESEPFVSVRTAGKIAGSEDIRCVPSLRDAVGGNSVVLGFSEVAGVEPPVLLVVAALDNLLKGAAGQAVQNTNLMLGMDEREGLRA